VFNVRLIRHLYTRNRRWAPSAADLIAIGTTTPEGFTGHEMLDGVGLIHMNGRVYDPAVGRFLSVDPLVRDLGASQSWNGYGYVEGHVLSSTDPSGYDPQCPGGNKTIVNCNPVPPDPWFSERMLSRDSYHSIGGHWDDSMHFEWLGNLESLVKESRWVSTGINLGMMPAFDAGLGSGGYELPSRTVSEGGDAQPQREQDQNRINMCYAQADAFGNKAGTLAGFTVAGGQAGPEGALLGLGVGLAVAGLQDYLSGPGPQAIADGAGSMVLDGPSGFIGSQYDAMVRTLFPDKPGLAYPLGGAAGNTITHIVRTRALAGAARAGRWGAGAGLAYLGGYAGGFSLVYNNCMSN